MVDIMLPLIIGRGIISAITGLTLTATGMIIMAAIIEGTVAIVTAAEVITTPDPATGVMTRGTASAGTIKKHQRVS